MKALLVLTTSLKRILLELAFANIMPDYTLYGLQVRSDTEIPGLERTFAVKIPDVHVRYGEYTEQLASSGSVYKLRFASRYLDSASGLPQLAIWEQTESQSLIIEYIEGIQFHISHDGSRLEIAHRAGIKPDEVYAYLLGPVFGVLLRQRGVVCLHASAVVMKGRAIAFVGASGRGKSTVAALMGRAGYGIITDDVLALGPINHFSISVFPGYPRLKLWPKIAHQIAGREDGIFPIVPENPEWEKLYLHLSGDNFRFIDQPHTLGAIYELVSSPSFGAHPVTITAVERASAMLTLLASTFANNVIDRRLRAEEFSVLGAVVDTVPVYRLAIPPDAASLADKLDPLISHISTLMPELEGR